MKFIVLLGLLACAAAFFVSGASARQWILNEATNNTHIEVTIGDTIVVQLAGNPTTGHRWILSCLAGDAAIQTGPRTYKANGNGHGSGGVYSFPLSVVDPGHGSISVRYARNWVGADTINTFSANWHSSRPKQL